jgi:hypothetical protein
MTNPDERGSLPGPRTEEGKEVARWNATRHGINSPAPVIPGLEKAEDWEEHRSGVLDSLTPKGHLECVLTERVALLFWRLHRVTRYETESIALAQEKMAEDLARARRFDSDFGPGDPEVAQASLKRAQAYYRLLKRFPKLNDDKKLSASDAQNILWDVAEHTDAASEGEVEVEDLLENLSLPGLTGGFSSWEEDDDWSVGMVRAGIEAIASSADRDGPEAVLEAATKNAQWKAKTAKQEAEKAERDLERMSRERLLPDEKTLEKVARYEAHLSRLLHKTLHELEALQTRRLGGSAPLARLDIQGLPES